MVKEVLAFIIELNNPAVPNNETAMPICVQQCCSVVLEKHIGFFFYLCQCNHLLLYPLLLLLLRVEKIMLEIMVTANLQVYFQVEGIVLLSKELGISKMAIELWELGNHKMAVELLKELGIHKMAVELLKELEIHNMAVELLKKLRIHNMAIELLRELGTM